jgi:hypothetical protein
MPLPLTIATVVMCAHGGKCMPTTPLPRVKVNGVPVVGLAAPWMVTGCPQPQPGGCITVKFVSGSLRVKAQGMPLVLNTSVGMALPSAAPVTIVNPQVRVKAQ